MLLLKKLRNIPAVLAALVLALLICGCSARANTVVIDPDDLHGIRVGANLAWETDYVVTERGDAEIYRYDETADMLMALNYNKIDAIALDQLSYRLAELSLDGVEMVEPPIGYSPYLLYLAPDKGQLRDDFNAFFAEYEQSEEYRELMERVDAFDGDYQGREIEATGTGETIRVAANDAAYPRCYYDPGAREPVGYEVELVQTWANARNYRIEWCRSNYDDIVNGLRAGKYDVGVGYLSEYYRDEAELAGLNTTDGFIGNPIYLIRKSGDTIRVTGEI